MQFDKRGRIFFSAAEFYCHSAQRRNLPVFSCKFNREIREIEKYNIQQRGKNYPCRERNIFPSSKDKKFLLWRAPKNPLSAYRGFPVSERFGKKKYRNSVKFFYSVS